MIFFYLAQALFVLGMAATAASLIAHGRRRQQPGITAAGVVLGGLLLALIVSVVARPDVDEWNPPVGPGALLGRWVDGARTLELSADSTFRVTAGDRLVAAGPYHRFDWNLTLVDTVGRRSEAWRAVIADHEYRIIRDVEDPDMWGGDLGYRRISSAASTRKTDLRAPAP